MSFKRKILSRFSVVVVEVEGFFTERFINICKFKNIRIKNIKNITNGIIRFNINIDEFKKIKEVAKKTKCKIKIKEKKGIYFKMFKYRKRKYIIYLIATFLILVILSNSFIWKINLNIGMTEEVKLKLEEAGLNVGKLKIGLNENKISKKLRAKFTNYSWIGVDINGGHINIEFKEKVTLKDNNIQETKIGDIYANKSGILTKIIPEKGTAIYKTGSYIEEGTKVIEGKIYSEYLGEIDTTSKGIIRIKSEYIFGKEYKYLQTEKIYNKKNKYNLGFSVDLKEFYLNYLKTNQKYDKIKKSTVFNFFNKTISLDLYTLNLYDEIMVNYSYEELLEKYKFDEKLYIDNVLKDMKDPRILDFKEEIIKNEDGISVKKTYVIEEEIGVFKER